MRRIGFSSASLLLALAAAVPFLPGLPGAFVFDDYHVIVHNPSLRLDAWRPAQLLDAALSTRTGILKRPLALLSFALDFAFHGLAPFGWKLCNIAIHALNAVLLFCLLRTLLPYLLPDADPEHCVRVAWVTAALWAVHPLNLTTVLYVVQRMTGLCATFMLTSLLLYAKLRTAGALSHARAAWHLGLFVLCAIAALLTKEMAAVLPLYVLIVESRVLRFAGIERWRLPVFAGSAGFVALGSVLLYWRPEILTAAYANRDFTLDERLLTESRVLVTYLRWLVLPDLTALGLFHDDIPLSRGLLAPPSTLPAVLAVAGIAALCCVRRWPLLAFAGAWFFGGHLLESSVWPLEIAHEHRNYLPGIGVLLLAVASAARWCAPSRRKAAAVAVLVSAAGVTALRAADWRDALIQVEVEASHHPRSMRAQYELGRVRFEQSLARGDPAGMAAAGTAFERAAALAPQSPLPLAALLRSALIRRDEAAVAGLIDRAGALPQASARVRLLQDAVECQATAVCPPHGRATQTLARAALELAPPDSPAGRDALEWLAIFYLRVLGDGSAGCALLRDLVAQAPRDLPRALRLGEALLATGETAEALTVARAIGRLLPWHAPWSERPQWRRWQRLLTAAAARSAPPDGSGG